MAARAGAATPPVPVATYEANLHDARPGDAFEMAITVTWDGQADAYDIRIPEPEATDGVRFRMLGTESNTTGNRTRMRFRWQVAVDAPGTLSLSDLVPVMAYAPDQSAPLTVQPRQPLIVTVDGPPSRWRRVALFAVGGAALGLAVGGVLTLRRRHGHADAEETRAAERQHLDELAAELAEARAHRIAGDPRAYLHRLEAVAAACDLASEARDELRALAERTTFGSYQPTDEELDRAAALVRRRIETRHAQLEQDET